MSDVVCDSGPGDPRFEEQHEGACIAIVTEGTFQYRTDAGAGVLVPGALLLGNHGACYECGHDHGTGDRCLSFQFTPDYLESVGSRGPAGRGAPFPQPQLPPLPPLMRLMAEAQAARDTRETQVFEELAARLAAAVADVFAGVAPRADHASTRAAQRISEALRRIEAEAHLPLSLAELARGVGMSAFHFLRTFRGVTGMTPHQYVLRTRLHRAAVQLRSTRKPVSAIALDAGFNDLSTFNRRFQRFMGLNPSAFRYGRP